MPPSPRKHAGAPKGNFNALRHGLFTSRVRRHTPSGDEIIDLKGLCTDIALIRVFTRKLVESCSSDASFSELADILRILCHTTTVIARTLRLHYLITGSESGLDPEIESAVLHVQSMLAAKRSSPSANPDDPNPFLPITLPPGEPIV